MIVNSLSTSTTPLLLDTFTVKVNFKSNVVGSEPFSLVTSNVVDPRSSAKVSKLTRPAISPDGNKLNPCGRLLALPDLS